MKSNLAVKNAIECYKENELILASKLYRKGCRIRSAKQHITKRLKEYVMRASLLRLQKAHIICQR